ncbi:MAG: hypothetical protein V4805_00655 [Pseudomonadota bacterium]
MNKIIKIVSSCSFLLGCLLCSSAVQAELSLKSGVDLIAPAANTGAVGYTEQASTVRDTRKSGGHTLRCWHQGKLLYEGTGFRHEVDRNPNTINIPRMDGGDAVVIMDLKDAVCILSKN